jgi:hypothetical protein
LLARPVGERVKTEQRLLKLIFHLPQLIYLSLSMILIAAILGKIGVRYAFNANEGWNAFWAAAAWDGAELYPPPSSLKLNNYVPLWFYATGALGRLTGDNIQAGRILAGLALLLNGIFVSLIVREITGRGRDCWFAGAAFLAICGLFYADYAGTNDPQLAANLFMTLTILLFVRWIGRTSTETVDGLVVPLLLLGGLLKHNVVAAPISICVFLLFYRRRAFVHFAVWSCIGLAAVSGVLFVLYGPAVFLSLLSPRPIDLTVAWSQTLEQLALYNAFLLAVGYLAVQSDAKARFISIYAIVALTQGLAFSSGFDVDVNVFFDFAIATSIGLGVVQFFIVRALERRSGGPPIWISLPAWIAVTLTAPIAAAPSAMEEATRVFGAITETAQRADIVYIESSAGPALCQNLALCYWAGKRFDVDTNNLKTLVLARPDLERDFVARVENCAYSLIQLNDDWDSDEYDAPFTQTIVEALKHHSAQVYETETASYRRPLHCAK